jgi:acetylornithine/succinyldiaminopimelate/putrescine aminotransferase
LDFGSGIAVNALGYGREDLAQVAYEQMKKLIHISNLYTTAPAVKLAEALTSAGNFAAVHFGNSGTEANEAALKYARLYSQQKKGPGHHKFLSFSNGFHGRSMGSLSVTATEKYKTPFGPLVPGCEIIDYNSLEQLEALPHPEEYAAVIVEVIQGEGGLYNLSAEMVKRLNSFCRDHDIILIADEVQTGIGRTGTIFASSGFGLEPDIITLAKPLAAGLPLSATLIPAKINDLLKVGDHASTFGGGPVTTSVALKAWGILTEPSFLQSVEKKGILLKSLLQKGLEEAGMQGEFRGKGLLCGLITDAISPEKIPVLLDKCKEKGLLILRSGKNVIRMAPPLIIEEKELREGVEILLDTIKEIHNEG